MHSLISTLGAALFTLSAAYNANAQSYARHGDTRQTDQVTAKNPIWTHGGVHNTLKASSAAGSGGYTPTQIRHAYGFDQITGNGAGQTIGIVVAYGSPTLQQDVATFSSTYGLPPANITVAYPQGTPSGAVSYTHLTLPTKRIV